MTLKDSIKQILREEVQQKLIYEENKTPQNETYQLPKDYTLKSDATFGDDLTIPKGTKFTSHYNSETDKSFVSVDRIVPPTGYETKNKITYSTVFYCNGTNQGKFWNASSKSFFIDDKKVLSNILFKNVCFRAAKDKWVFQNKEKKTQEKSLAKSIEASPYVDDKGNKALYHMSTEFKKTNDFLISQGLNVRGVTGIQMPKPKTPNQHYNYAALFSIKQVTDYAINKIGWSNSQCLQIGLSELGNVKWKSKTFSKYNIQLSEEIKNEKSPLYTQINQKLQLPYANFILSDFYFKFANLIKDVEANPNRNDTYYFPDGVYNFMGSFFGTTNVSQIQKGYTKSPGCKGNSVNWHGVLTTLQFVSAFIPVAGPFIAAGLGIADAGLAYSEGKKGEAAIGFILSAVPLAAEIPGLKSVGQTVLTKIGSKILKDVPLTAYESEVAGLIKANEEPIAAVTDKWVKANFKNKTVQHIVKTTEEKGEEWLEEKIKEKVKEKTGLDIPLTIKGAEKVAVDVSKNQAINYLDKKLA